MEKHVELKNGKIIYASTMLHNTLTLFYFGMKTAPYMTSLSIDFKGNLFVLVETQLKRMDLSWQDVPDETSNWGVVIDRIKKLESNEIQVPEIDYSKIK